MSQQRRNSNSSIHQQQLLEAQAGTSYGSISTSKRGKNTPSLSVIEDQDASDSYESDGYSASISSANSRNARHVIDSDDEEDDDYFNLEEYEDHNVVLIKDEISSIFKSAVPLSITFFFEYLLAVNSLFLIGHLGSKELASASLAVMTFNITGMAAFEGMSTCLDTFCSQAYGAKKYHRVGLYFQRCTAMIFTLSIPIMGLWWFSKYFLSFIVPEEELLELTQLYLRVLCAGTPGLIAFETGKRFLQSQKIFHASTYVLFICLPVNVALNFWFIRIWGFIGAPLAIVTTYWLMAILLFLYVILVDGKQCWNGLTSRALKRWRPMLDLALPGLVMIESEYLSFEVLTVMASYFGTEALASQSIVSNIGSLVYQFPFAIGCAISTRVAIYIGSGSIKSSKVTIRLSYLVAAGTSLTMFLIILLLRYPLTLLFTSDEKVIEHSVRSMPILAFNQFADTFNIISAGILRSQGRQKVGSILNIISYYVVALPLAYIFAFKFGLQIRGLWLGLGSGVLLLGVSETICVIRTNWRWVIKESFKREEEEYEVIDDTSTIASGFSGLQSD